MRTFSNTPETPLRVMHMLQRAQAGLTDESGKEIRVGLIIGGGALSTAWGAGWCYGLQKTGLNKNLKVIVGISGGAPIGTALNIDESERVPPVYELLVEELQIMNMRRRGKTQEYVFELLGKFFPEETFRQGPADLYAVVTHYPSGESDLLKLNIDVMRATISIPIPLLCRPVDIDGTRYVDGACCPVPLRRIIEEFRLTDVIYLGSRPHRQDTPIWQRQMSLYSIHAALYYYSPIAIREGMMYVDIFTESCIREMETAKDVRCLAFMPSYKNAIPVLPAPWLGIGPFEKMDAETIRGAVMRGDKSFTHMFSLL